MDPRGEITVAIVDDDPSLCRSLARLLRASGLVPVTFASAEAFLADRSSRFACLILDIQLGGMSGLELLKQLGGENNGLPVIIITAHDDPEIRRRSLEAGGAAFFRKSDPGEAIVTRIREITPPLTASSRTAPSSKQD